MNNQRTRTVRAAALSQPADFAPPGVRYRISLADPDAHRFRIECTVDHPDPAGVDFALPAWTPGSYLIRDFARHIVAFTACADGAPVPVRKIDLHTWRVETTAVTLTVCYDLYAWDLSVRGAHLDASHGFFNGAALYLRVVGREALPCAVELCRPDNGPGSDWRLATTLPLAPGATATATGFGHYQAADYATLIDHPVEMGRFDQVDFHVGGVAHRIAVTGRHQGDLPRLARDLQQICATQVALFGAPPPFSRYLFLLTVVDDGYGGLEHRDSTALIARRTDLRHPHGGAPDEGYRSLLGLASHEYFHAWNVKRLHPRDFDELDLQRPQPTDMLWFFEGFTAYYDDLLVRRAGLIRRQDYLDTLGKTIERVLATPGRAHQSVAAASFDAWIRLYRPDENTANSTVSYYAKGALVALALDLRLRRDSDGKRSLDDLMRALWRRFGRDGESTRGMTEADILTALTELAGKPVARFLRQAVHGTDDLPLAKLFKPFGVSLATTPAEGASLGIKLDTKGDDARIASVVPGGAAQRAGLAAGDVLIALDGLRVSRKNLPGKLARHQPGDPVGLHAFRRDELLTTQATLDAPAAAVRLTPVKSGRGQTTRRDRLREGWLGRTRTGDSA